MLMAGFAGEDYSLAALAVDFSGIYTTGFAGDAAVRCVPYFCRHVDVEVFKVSPGTGFSRVAAQIVRFADAFRAVSTRPWPRTSPTLVVACAWLVLWVSLFFAPCFLLLSSGP